MEEDQGGSKGKQHKLAGPEDLKATIQEAAASRGEHLSYQVRSAAHWARRARSLPENLVPDLWFHCKTWMYFNSSFVMAYKSIGHPSLAKLMVVDSQMK